MPNPKHKMTRFDNQVKLASESYDKQLLAINMSHSARRRRESNQHIYCYALCGAWNCFFVSELTQWQDISKSFERGWLCFFFFNFTFVDSSFLIFLTNAGPVDRISRQLKHEMNASGGIKWRQRSHGSQSQSSLSAKIVW